MKQERSSSRCLLHSWGTPQLSGGDPIAIFLKLQSAEADSALTHAAGDLQDCVVWKHLKSGWHMWF